MISYRPANHSDADPPHPLQQTLQDLERAYANYFAQRAQFPRFKRKDQSDSFRYPDPEQTYQHLTLAISHI